MINKQINAKIMKILKIYNFPAKLALHDYPDKVNPELHVEHEVPLEQVAHPFGQLTQVYNNLFEVVEELLAAAAVD